MLRGFSLKEAFTPTQTFQESPDGIQLEIDDTSKKSLVERKDKRGQVAYGIRHMPDAHVKLFNASTLPQSSLALSFSSATDQYDDVFKIVKRANGGYELHLQKINSIFLDGKEINVSSLQDLL